VRGPKNTRKDYTDDCANMLRLVRSVSVHSMRSYGAPQLTNTELVQLRVRVIALENLVIALLAQASDRQLEVAREMAAYICPRPGFTQHPLTIHAAAQMIHMVERAARFHDLPSC